MIVPGIYRHFKGRFYMVFGEFPNTETGEVIVAYRALYEPFTMSHRTRANFTEEIDRPDFAYKGPRFVLAHAP